MPKRPTSYSYFLIGAKLELEELSLEVHQELYRRTIRIFRFGHQTT